jgi:hypothetical protein
MIPMLVSPEIEAQTRSGPDKSRRGLPQVLSPPVVIVKQFGYFQMVGLMSKEGGAIRHQRPQIPQAGLNGFNEIRVAEDERNPFLKRGKSILEISRPKGTSVDCPEFGNIAFDGI